MHSNVGILPSGAGTEVYTEPCPIECNEDRAASLTCREREMMRLIGQGLCNKDIATLINISEQTAREHRKHICTKLGIHSTAQLVCCAVRYSSGLCRIASQSDD